MYKTRFWLDLLNAFVPGWFDPSKTRGWPTPYIEFQDASTLVRRYNQVEPGEGRRAWYDQDGDAFCFMPGSDATPECYAAEIITVDGTELKVYPIGGSGWEWEEDSEA